ncbi:MAG: hypothetical protein AAB726_00190, partial [Patescibacteria group bacterium]
MAKKTGQVKPPKRERLKPVLWPVPKAVLVPVGIPGAPVTRVEKPVEKPYSEAEFLKVFNRVRHLLASAICPWKPDEDVITLETTMAHLNLDRMSRLYLSASITRDFDLGIVPT